MKRPYHLKDREGGFFLPYVMVICSIIIILVINTTHLYQQELEISHALIEQVRYESLYNMSVKKLLQEKPYDINEEGVVSYEFPNGTTEVHYKLKDSWLEVNVTVHGDHGHKYEFYRNLPSNNHT